MNAISLYIQTCRYVMQAQPNDVTTWEDLYRYLPYLRQSLQCCVCTKVLLCPMGPIESKCQHHVCRDCRGGKMRLRPSCSWCKNWQEYVENNQLRLIVQCFKKLCDYLASSFIAQHLINNSQSGESTLLSIITEGRTVNDDYSFSPSASLAVPSLLPSKISASNGTIPSLVTVKQEPIDTIDTTQYDNADTAPIHDIANTNNEHCDDNDAHAGASDQQNSTLDAEELSKVTSTSGPEPLDNLVTSSSSGVANSDTQGQDNVGTADEQSQESPPAENGISDDTEEIQDAVMAPHSIHLEHSQHQQPSCSSSEPASSGPNSPNYDSYSRGGHAASAGEQDFNKETYTGIYSVSMSNDHAPKLKIRRTDRGQHHTPSTSNSGIDQETQESSHSTEYKHKSRSKVRQKKRPKGCRCGLATPTPGKLTCCGQRCPCYSAFKGCLPQCRCRGCRNPRKVQIFDDAPELSPNEDDDSDADDDSEIEVDV